MRGTSRFARAPLLDAIREVLNEEVEMTVEDVESRVRNSFDKLVAVALALFSVGMAVAYQVVRRLAR